MRWEGNGITSQAVSLQYRSRAWTQVCATPEAFKRIAPGRAQHAPGEDGVDLEHAPRQGCEDSGGCNPCRGRCLLGHPGPGVASHPGKRRKRSPTLEGLQQGAEIFAPPSGCVPFNTQKPRVGAVAPTRGYPLQRLRRTGGRAGHGPRRVKAPGLQSGIWRLETSPPQPPHVGNVPPDAIV